ncbi:MAG TPA: outer membrane beta-barrel protein [Gammaproteobacteria bacterium]|jgi:hypothetical protein|nr:outer membrane beta-barrel protein [Gammaproteobacteria bacterium]
MKVKKIGWGLAAYGVAMAAHATAPGLYLGLMAGPATNNASTSQVYTAANPALTTTATPKSSQFGSRVYVGYKFNPYAGFEGGFNYYSNIKYDTKDVDPCTGVSQRVKNIDFVGKGEFDFRSLSVFGKLGVAASYLTTSGAFSKGPAGECGKNKYSNKFSPTFSLGVGYDLDQSWLVDLTWQRTMEGGSVGSMDFYALGLSYHFVDKYCGQFLCDD